MQLNKAIEIQPLWVSDCTTSDSKFSRGSNVIFPPLENGEKALAGRKLVPQGHELGWN